MKPKTHIKLEHMLLRSSGIPARFDDLDMDRSFVSEPTERLVNQYVCAEMNHQNPHRLGLFISGPPVSGKTFLSVYCLRHFLAKGCLVTRMTHAELLELGLSDSFSRNAFLSHFGKDIICIDDVVSDTQKSGYTRPLIRLIKYCRDEGKILILVTELKFNDFVNDYYKPIGELLQVMLVRVSTTPRLSAVTQEISDWLTKHLKI